MNVLITGELAQEDKNNSYFFYHRWFYTITLRALTIKKYTFFIILLTYKKFSFT